MQDQILFFKKWNLVLEMYIAYYTDLQIYFFIDNFLS